MLLLAAGTSVDARSLNGSTPLHLAVASGSKRMVELLVAHGADVRATNDAGLTPVELADRYGQRGIATTLMLKATATRPSGEGEP